MTATKGERMSEILSDEQIEKALEIIKSGLMKDEHYCQALADCPWKLKDAYVFDSGFKAGARFALAAAAEREKLWRELVFLLLDECSAHYRKSFTKVQTVEQEKREGELRAALGIGEGKSE